MNEGIRFSLLYLDRSKTLGDSQRFRNRLSAFYWEFLHETQQSQIVRAIQLEIGADVPFATYSYSLSDFFKKTELRDLLDSITVIYRALISSGYGNLAEKWKNFIQRSLSEENLGFRIDT